MPITHWFSNEGDICGGFVAELTLEYQGRVFQIDKKLWRWEVIELTKRTLLAVGHEDNLADAKAAAHRKAFYDIPE